jgi:16S rRNA (adenine1518-N6/adenine1519-N6)-dimethyltransferase
MTTNYPKKRYAQYWLQDQRVLDQIVAAAHLQADDRVLEIGPGTGNLTEMLLSKKVSVEAIEIDQALEERLARRFVGRKFQVQFGDVLALPLPPTPTVVVANIPYYITGLILDKLLGSPSAPNTQFRRVVLLVQREIGERLVAQPSTPAYNALSVVMQYLAEVELISIVKPSSFRPNPKVDSAVVALTPRPYALTVEAPTMFERLLKQGFSQRRKMLRNTLKPFRSTLEVEDLLTQLGERTDSRAEMLSVSQWVQFVNRWTHSAPLNISNNDSEASQKGYLAINADI